MITLYQFATSPFTEKIRRALHYKGLNFDEVEVVRNRVPEGDYSDVSPTGKFPAISDEGVSVWDSTDIIYHLEKNHQGASLVPIGPRDAAIAHAIEEWADESLYFYEMTMRLTWENNLDAALDEFSATMPAVPKDQLRELIKTGATQLTQAQGVGRKPKQQIVKDVERHLTALNNMLEGRQWLVGESLSFADLAVLGQLNALLYAEEASAFLNGKTNITAWVDRVDQVAPK